MLHQGEAMQQRCCDVKLLLHWHGVGRNGDTLAPTATKTDSVGESLCVYGQEQPDGSKEAKKPARQVLASLKESQLMELGGQSFG